MRVLKIIVLALLAAILLLLAVANRQFVTLSLLPDGIADLPFASAIDLPLFVVVLLSIFVGVVLGLWMELGRERTVRREGRAARREARKLEGEVKRLSKKAGEEDDDILGISHG